MENRISVLESAIHDLDRIADSRDLNDMERARLNAENCLLNQWLIKRERVWRQRAKSYGFCMKDHNTKFFYASTIYKRKKNEIIQISINGRRVRGVSNLKHEVRNYFVQRFIQQHTPAFEFNLDNHQKLSAEQVQQLENIPSREEVQQAVWACGTDKAPGFDGFNFKFFREMWEVLKDEIYDLVLDFFVNGSSVSHLNITWVSLIPKSGNPTSIEDYRPISMVGALYKIISKILSLRLKVVIAYLIDESQTSFVGNRQILDGVMIANESIRWLKKENTGYTHQTGFRKGLRFCQLVFPENGVGKARVWSEMDQMDYELCDVCVAVYPPQRFPPETV